MKDRFTNMGTPEETYEAKGGKVLKIGPAISLRRVPSQALVVPVPSRERLNGRGPPSPRGPTGRRA